MDHVGGGGGRMMCHGTSNLQSSRSLCHHGRLGVKFGQIRSSPVIRGYLLTCLLFSEIHESLVHHYRVHKRGLPHLTFQKDYLTCLRVFALSQAAALSQGDMVSPVQLSPVSMRHACSSEQ